MSWEEGVVKQRKILGLLFERAVMKVKLEPAGTADRQNLYQVSAKTSDIYHRAEQDAAALTESSSTRCTQFP